MNLPILFLPTAQEEFDDAKDWYERERDGLGTEFTHAVHESLQRVVATPELYAKVFDDVRRAPVRGFRYYVILYALENDHIAVISVFHTRRDPSIWRQRRQP